MIETLLQEPEASSFEINSDEVVIDAPGANVSCVGQGYKASEVGVVPVEWTVSTVGGEFEIQLGKMLDAERNKGVSVPYLGNRAVQWGRFDVDDLPMVAMSKADLKRYRVAVGDLLVCEGGEVGRGAIWQGELTDCYFQKALHRLRSKQGYRPDLMLAYMRRWADLGLLANYVTQTSIAHLPKDKFETIPLAVPPVPEQEAIAKSLGDVDALILALERLIAKKRDLKQAAMERLLTGRTRLQGFTGEWRVKTLRELARIEMGRTPSRAVDRYWGEGHPWISIADLHGKTITSTKEQISQEGAALMQVIRKGTLIMSFKLSLGRLAFTGQDMYSNEAICSFNELKANACYLYHALHRVDFSLYGKQAVKGFTLNKQSLGDVEVTCPALEEQAAIASVLDLIDEDIACLEQRLRKESDVKEGMMQELLTGRIRLA